MNEKEVAAFLLSFPETWLDFPFGEDVAVYKYRHGDEDKMFALIAKGSQPLRLSLRCDPQLAEVLREQYETVLPGQNLNQRNWNTIICSGQLDESQLRDFMRHSYQLVAGS